MLSPVKPIKVFTILGIVVGLMLSYFGFLSVNGYATFEVGGQRYPLPAASTNLQVTAPAPSTQPLNAWWQETLQQQLTNAAAQRRQTRIDKVESFFRAYNGGSALMGLGDVFVDQAEACGGDYRILVGIAGSESGLGRVMYKKYNPFGYLDGVTYPSLREAITQLTCKISKQHISRCGDDLFCLARRYGGPATDLNHFVSKVKWFATQVS